MGTLKKIDSMRSLVAICAIVLIASLLYCASKCCSSITCCGVFCSLMTIFLLALVSVILYFVFSYYRHCDDQMIEIAKLAIQNAVKKEEREHDKEMFKLRFVQRMLEDSYKNQHELELKAKEKEIIHYHLGEKFIEEAYHYIANGSSTSGGGSADSGNKANDSSNKANELGKANEMLMFIINEGVPQGGKPQGEKPQGGGTPPPFNPTT